MRIRQLAPFALALTVACGGAETEDTAAVDEATQEYAAGADADAEAIAAVAQIAEDWEAHHNMGAGHAGMATAGLADDGLMWSGDGSMLFSKADIVAAMEADLEANAPQIQIETDESIVMDNFVFTRGTYAVTAEMEGEAITTSGYWTGLAENIEGEWMLHGVVGNLDSPMPEGMPAAPAAEMPENGEGAELLQERLDYYMTHFNAGHPDMVAATYTEDAVVMGSGQAAITGRDAALERLTEMTAAGAQITDISVWSASEYADGQYVGGIGTYTLQGADGEMNGHFMGVYQRGDDGTLMLHWLLTSDHPTAM